MSNQGHDNLRQIFDAAIALTGPAREAYLDEQCAADPDLRKRIVAMLAAAEDDRFLGDPTIKHPAPISAAAPTTAASPLREGPGTKVGPYKLLQLIGEGGFGAVFMADQEHPVRRRVALKIIKLGMDTRQVVARFEQERQALALMDHPNIAKVHDAGATDSGRPYFVMEYVKGDPITRFADAHKLSVKARLDLFTQVCQAVQHAHMKGLIHRDLKPGNMLVSMTDGRPFAKVIDFGIAKATGARLTDKTLFTEHHQLIGTPEYMSPEQAEGSPDIDTRTDVYALGVLLYELLSGTTPFDAKRLRSAAFAEMQRIIKEEEPPAPSLRLTRSLETLAATAAARQTEPAKLGSLIKGELDWIVMKALDKDRARRYETPNQFAADVNRYLTGEPVLAAPPSLAYRAKKFIKRYKGPVLTASAIAATLILATGVLSIALRTTSSALESEERQRDAAEWNAYTAGIALAQIAMANEDWPEARLRIAACLESKRGWEWRYLQRKAEAVRWNLGGGSPSVFSPEGSRVLTRWDEDIELFNALSGKEIGPSMQHDSTVISAVFSLDGKQLLSVSDNGKVWRWDAATCKQIGESMNLMPEGYKDFLRLAVISPDGASLLTAVDEPEARLWNATTGKQIGEVMPRDSSVISAVFSPDATRVLTTDFRGRTLLFDAHSGKELCEQIFRKFDVSSAVFSPDGTRVLTATGFENEARHWNASTCKQIGEAMRAYDGMQSAIFSPDGARVLTTSNHGTGRLWNVTTGKYTGVTMVQSWHPVFNGDGSLLLTASYYGGVAYLWTVSSGQCLGLVGGSYSSDDEQEGVVRSFNPDGTLVMVSNSSWGRICTVQAFDWSNGYQGADLSAELDVLLADESGRHGAPRPSVTFRQTNDGSVEALVDGKTPSIHLPTLNEIPRTASLTPDGARLVTVSDDNSVRFWETSAGRQVADFGKLAAEELQFTPDGTRLILKTSHTSACIWDTRGPADRRADWDARTAQRAWASAYVNEKLAGPKRTEELDPDFRKDKSISPLRRLVALEVLRQRIAPIDLEANNLFYEIKRKKGLPALVRAAALKITGAEPRVKAALVRIATDWDPTDGYDDTYEWNELSELAWNVVQKPDATSDLIDAALEAAHMTARADPDDAGALSTLGVAQYRAGEFQNAIVTLGKAESQHEKARHWAASDLIFAAMAQFQLGNVDAARSIMARVVELSRNPRAALNQESAAFFHEADALIESRVGNATMQSTSAPSTQPTSQPASPNLTNSAPTPASQPATIPVNPIHSNKEQAP